MPVEGDGTYDLVKIGKWRGIVPKHADRSLTVRDKDNVRSLAISTDMSNKEISEATGVGIWSVVKLRQELKNNQSLIDLYKDKQSEIFALQRIRTDRQLTNEKLEMSSAKELVDISEKLYKMQRLEDDKSTENVGVMVQMIREAKERLDERA